MLAATALLFNMFTCESVIDYVIEQIWHSVLHAIMYLYNKGNTRNLERDGIILAEFGSARRFVDLLRWTH